MVFLQVHGITALSASKAGLADRLDNVLLSPKLGRMLKSPTALPLDEFCNQGKVGAGRAGTQRRRRRAGAADAGAGRHDRLAAGHQSEPAGTPVHVFVDEAQRMIGPTILEIMNELRKFGMRLTLAHQSLSQSTTPTCKRRCEWRGHQDPGRDRRKQSAHAVARDGRGKNPDASVCDQMGDRRSADVMLRKSHDHLRGGRNDMTPAAWQELLQYSSKPTTRGAMRPQLGGITAAATAGEEDELL